MKAIQKCNGPFTLHNSLFLLLSKFVLLMVTYLGYRYRNKSYDNTASIKFYAKKKKNLTTEAQYIAQRGK